MNHHPTAASPAGTCDMDCHLATLLLAFPRADLAAEDATGLDAHLAGCPRCGDAARAEAARFAAVGSAMRAVPIPATLQGKLYARAADYRLAQWRKVGTYAAATAVAASLLVMTAAAVGWWAKPTLDAEAIAQEFDHQRDLPEQAAAAWLRAEGLPAELPWAFDLRLVSFRGRAELQGRTVPTLVLQAPRDTAQLYFVREGQFKLDPAKLKTTLSSWGTVEIERRDGFVFVLIYTGPDLAPFLRHTPVG